MDRLGQGRPHPSSTGLCWRVRWHAPQSRSESFWCRFQARRRPSPSIPTRSSTWARPSGWLSTEDVSSPPRLRLPVGNRHRRVPCGLPRDDGNGDHAHRGPRGRGCVVLRSDRRRRGLARRPGGARPTLFGASPVVTPAPRPAACCSPPFRSCSWASGCCGRASSARCSAGRLALGAAASRPSAGRIPVPQPDQMPAGLLLGVTLGGADGVHPNALLTLMHLGILALTGALAMTAWRCAHRSGHSRAVWIAPQRLCSRWSSPSRSRPAARHHGEDRRAWPELERSVRTRRHAPLRAAKCCPPPSPTILAAVGALTVFRLHRSAGGCRSRPGYFAVLFYLNVAVDTPVVRYLTWPWFNNAVRLAAVGVLPAALLVTRSRVPGDRLVEPDGSTVARCQVFATVLVVGAFLGLSRGYVPVHERWLNRYFHPDSAHSWVSPGGAGRAPSLRRADPSRRGHGGEPLEWRHLPLRRERTTSARPHREEPHQG